MSKRHSVAFTKPNEPTFIKRIKEQIGYKEGPTVETKRQKLEEDFSESDNRDDEQPLVVVLQEGDLTAAEAEAHQKQKEKEEEEKPADLSQPIVFKSKSKKSSESKSEKTAQKSKKNLLSFDDDEDVDGE